MRRKKEKRGKEGTVTSGCQLIIQFEIFHENHAIRGVAHGDFLQRDRKDKRRLQWKMSLARRDWPEDSSQHLRLRKLTLDDRLLPSVRAIRVKEAGNCDDTIAYRWMSDIHTHAERCTYLHRNTSSLVLFVVNRGKIDFILRSVPSISSCDTSRRVYWLCRTQPRVRREIHAPRVAPITPVDDWKCASTDVIFFMLCNGMLSVFIYLINIEFKVLKIVYVKYYFCYPF